MTCPKCERNTVPELAFCGNCGTRLTALPFPDAHNSALQSVSLVYFAIMGYLILLYVIDYQQTYVTSLITDSLLAGIVLLFFLLKRKENMRLLKPRKINKRALLILGVAMPLAALGVHLLASFINQSILNAHDSSYVLQYEDSPAPLFFTLLSVGVFPAIFEELAFRGVVFTESFKLMGLKASVFVTAILFTLLHFSVISCIWIFPLGVLFGYLRARYRTVLYGVIAHFLYNSTIVIIEVVTQSF